MNITSITRFAERTTKKDQRCNESHRPVFELLNFWLSLHENIRSNTIICGPYALKHRAHKASKLS